jgi:hypothetical protein
VLIHRSFRIRAASRLAKVRRGVFCALIAGAICVLAAPAAAIDTRPEFVIAILGDSYAAGEGSPDTFGRHSLLGKLSGPFAADCLVDPPAGRKPCHAETWWAEDTPVVYPQGDDPGWATETRRCHRSSRATGPRAAERIQDRFPQMKIVVLDFACTGGEIKTGLLEGYAGQELRDNPLLKPQVKALNDYVSGTSRHIDAILMNAGGNDSKFGDIIISCVFIVTASCAGDTALRDSILGPNGRLSNSLSPAYPAPDATVKSRYAVLDAAFRNASRPPGVPGLVAGRPDEVYVTSVPDPSHAGPAPGPAGNPQNFCDGSQTNDVVYSAINRSEAEFVSEAAMAMNARFAASAADHGWIFVDGIFEAFHDHGVCADDASFFRKLGDALKIQGNDFEIANLGSFQAVAPFLSTGIVHPIPAGYDAASRVVRDTVGEQVRMLLTAPTLSLGGIEPNAAFTLNWIDPTPLHAPETRWDVELALAQGGVSHLLSDGGMAGGFSSVPFAGSRLFTWRVQQTGEFTVRVRGCRATRTGFYCGPYSNAIVAATNLPGTPTNVRKNSQSTPNVVTWTPGPNTPAGVRYEVLHGRFGPVPCPANTPLAGGTCGQGIQTPQTTPTTATTFSLGSRLNPADSYGVAVRACNTAGCSPFSAVAVIPQRVIASLVGTFALRAPTFATVSQPAPIEVSWRTPRRWTDLDRVDLVVRDGRKSLGLVRFMQDHGVLWLQKGKKRRFGHPDENRRLRVGQLALDLGTSSVLRFGPKAKSVRLRLGLVPRKGLQRHRLRLELGGRDDRGRTQKPRVAGTLVVLP